MKLRELFICTSPLDDFTLKHLRQWSERFCPTDEDPETLCPRIVAFLESIDSTDSDALISRGWTAVFDAMEESK